MRVISGVGRAVVAGSLDVVVGAGVVVGAMVVVEAALVGPAIVVAAAVVVAASTMGRRVPHPTANASRASVSARDTRVPSDGQQVAGADVSAWVTQLRHGTGLDLADPFPGQVEVVTDLLEGAGLAPVEPVAQTDDHLLPLVEG